jgi:hypothetical protein
MYSMLLHCKVAELKKKRILGPGWWVSSFSRRRDRWLLTVALGRGATFKMMQKNTPPPIVLRVTHDSD